MFATRQFACSISFNVGHPQFIHQETIISTDENIVFNLLTRPSHLTSRTRNGTNPKNTQNVLGIVPGVMISAGTVLRERVVSELGGTLAPDALILTDAERSLDYCFCQPEPAAGGRGDGRVTAAMAAGSAQKGQPQKGVRHRRFMKEMDEQGFRR